MTLGYGSARLLCCILSEDACIARPRMRSLRWRGRVRRTVRPLLSRSRRRDSHELLELSFRRRSGTVPRRVISVVRRGKETCYERTRAIFGNRFLRPRRERFRLASLFCRFQLRRTVKRVTWRADFSIAV